MFVGSFEPALFLVLRIVGQQYYLYINVLFPLPLPSSQFTSLRTINPHDFFPFRYDTLSNIPTKYNILNAVHGVNKVEVNSTHCLRLSLAYDGRHETVDEISAFSELIHSLQVSHNCITLLTSRIQHC